MDNAKCGQLAPRRPNPWPKPDSSFTPTPWLMASISVHHSLLRTGAGQLDKPFNCHLGSSFAFSPAVLLATIAQIERCHPYACDGCTQSNHSPKQIHLLQVESRKIRGEPLTQLIKQQFGSWKRRRWRQSRNIKRPVPEYTSCPPPFEIKVFVAPRFIYTEMFNKILPELSDLFTYCL